MFMAYRGFSVILLAPVAAMLAVLSPESIGCSFRISGIFMEKMVGFIKLYLPVFLLVPSLARSSNFPGFQVNRGGGHRALWTKTGAALLVVSAPFDLWRSSLFVVVFAVYPLPRKCLNRNIPKRLIPGTMPWRVYLHDGFAARHSANSKYHSDDFFKTTLGRALAGVIGGLSYF